MSKPVYADTEEILAFRDAETQPRDEVHWLVRDITNRTLNLYGDDVIYWTEVAPLIAHAVTAKLRETGMVT